MFLWILAIICVLLLVYTFLIKSQLYWRNKGVPQGIPIPIFGDSWKFMIGMESMDEFIKRIYFKSSNARYHGIYQTIQPGIIIRDPDLIKQTAIKDFEHFMNHRNFAPESVDPVWNKNLFTLRGEEWRSMRATLSPTFTSSKMRAMFNLMNNSAKQYVDFYLKQNKSIVEIDSKSSFEKFASDVIANCAFGITCNSLENPTNEFYMHGHKVSDLNGIWKSLKFILNVTMPRIADYFKISVFPADSGNYFKSIVKGAVDYREANNIVRPDMINLLMEARKGKLKYDEDIKNKQEGFATAEESIVNTEATIKKIRLTDVDMAGQVLIFFFAGLDTVSTMMTFMSYELALNPDIQGKLKEEIDSTLYENNGTITYEALFNMNYLDMVISECLRKYPPIIGMERVCTKPYTIEPKDPGEVPVHIEVGTSVGYATMGMHYDPKFFPDPERFDPERFSDKNKANIQPYTYMPFGIGPRNCIGSRFALMEIKIFFFNVLSKFEIIAIAKTPIPLKMAKFSLNPRIAGGCWVGFQQRE